MDFLAIVDRYSKNCLADHIFQELFLDRHRITACHRRKLRIFICRNTDQAIFRFAAMNHCHLPFVRFNGDTFTGEPTQNITQKPGI